MTITPDCRIDSYLDGLDAASDFHWFPPSYDEWCAIRAVTGRSCGTYGRYLTERTHAGLRQSYAALTMFGAIDDDDFIPDTEKPCSTKR